MKLLTWNLRGRVARKPPSFQALDSLLAFLDQAAASDDVIACIQEAPLHGRALRQHVEGNSSRLSAVPVEAKAQLIHSRTLELRFARRSNNTGRTIIARFETAARSRLQIVGLHFHDQGTLAEPEVRGGAFAWLRANLDELLDSSLPVVVLGDFNAQPRDHEITSPYCFYARTSRDRVVDRHKKATGKFHDPFYVKEPRHEDHANGTYYFGRDEGWKTMDFLAVSKHLDARVTSIVRLTELLGKGLLTSSEKGIPNKDKFSDHLPVLTELDFQ